MTTELSLEEVLAQDVAISKAKSSFLQDSCRCVVVQGPSGSGKTWISKSVASEISDATPLLATGDLVRLAEEYAPFERLTKIRGRMESMAVDSARVAVGVGSYLSGFGTLGAKVFDWAVSATSVINSTQFQDLSEEEWRWIGKLRRMANGKPAVFVADNIHWWDHASFSLFEKITDSEHWRDHPFLSKLKFIVVRTIDPSQFDHTENLFLRWKQRVNPTIINTKKCTSDQFLIALQKFGAKGDIPPKTLEELYAISSGNLKLAKLISGALSEGTTAESFVSEADSHGLLRTLLAERFKSRDEKIESILATLKSAALIGMYFYRSEAACLTSKQPNNEDVNDNLESARETGLIDVDGEKLSFSHPVILDFVRREMSDSEVRDLSTKLARCLQLLKPADYRRQIDLFVAGGAEQEAAVAAALHYLQSKRRHEQPTDIVAPEHLQLLDRFKILPLCQKMEDAYDLFGEGIYNKAGGLLDTIPEPIHPSLALELVYARCLCKMESGRREDAASVASELGTFLAMEETNDLIEIATRFRLLQQQALVLAGTVEDARSNSIGLMSFLRKRAEIDSDAILKYHQVLRKSNSIHDPFTAKTHLLQAINFFQPERLGELHEYPVEYYRSLVNLSGVEIQLGNWNAACESASKACNMAKDNEGFHFPRLDVALNNLNIARCRAELDSFSKSIEQQKIAANHNHALTDNFQHRSNLAGMMLLSGELSDAHTVLAELESESVARGLSELYIAFHLESRQQVLSYLMRDWGLCKTQQSQISLLLQEIDWPSRPALLRRHEMMNDLIEAKTLFYPREFDKYFVELDPDGTGKSWPHFGRGILFSELQFWSDS